MHKSKDNENKGIAKRWVKRILQRIESRKVTVCSHGDPNMRGVLAQYVEGLESYEGENTKKMWIQHLNENSLCD